VTLRSEVNALGGDGRTPRIVLPLATWCQLRRAELFGLRRRDVDVKILLPDGTLVRNFTLDPARDYQPDPLSKYTGSSDSGGEPDVPRQHRERVTGIEPA
jgi:hypothetical protein